MTDGETIYNKIIDVWEEAESYTKEDVLQVILEVAESVRKYGKKLGSDTLRYIGSIREDAGECPICGGRLDTETHQGEISEAYGSDTYEDYTELTCNNCGWTTKND